MEPIQIQKVIDYLESNLKEDLSYAAIAKMMVVSEADLQRSFKMITGITISDYVRNRRLTCAALAIKNDNMKIVDAAMEYGYQTAESFSKAFKLYHGCTPQEAKDLVHTVRYFNPIVIKLAKRGGILTEYESYQDKADSVVAYYDASDERTRLTRSKHGMVEYLITMRYFDEMIRPGSKILDCCAGAGVYAFELAKEHTVIASDLSPKNVRQMRECQEENHLLQEIYQMDACDMSQFDDDSFDVVLCMGALYHIFDERMRGKVIQECKRVCKKDGLLVFAYLNKWGSFFNGMVNNLKSMEMLYQEYGSGNHEGIFYRSSPAEMQSLCEQEDLKCIYNVGIDHFVYLDSEKIDSMSEKEYKKLLEYQYLASKDSQIAGTSLHGLWIGRK